MEPYTNWGGISIGEEAIWMRYCIEFEKDELRSNHIFVPSALIRMGDLLLDKEDVEQAKHRLQEHSIKGQSDECLKNYQTALNLLTKFTPATRRKIAQINALMGAELEGCVSIFREVL